MAAPLRVLERDTNDIELTDQSIWLHVTLSHP